MFAQAGFFSKLLHPGPSLEGGLEELRELRPIRSRRLASSVANAVSWLRSCSISCCWTRMNCLASGGHDSQSASGIPAGGVLITDSLCLRSNQESSCRQGFSSNKVRAEPSRPLNGYVIFNPALQRIDAQSRVNR